MNRLIVTLVVALGAACHSHAPGEEHDDAHESERQDEGPALSFTHWTDDSELFIELPALVVGEESPCAAHVTALADFSALAEGSVTVALRSASGEQRFESRAPAVPGIFRPVVTPSAAGTYRLVVEVRGPELSTDHDLGLVTVFASVADARAAIPEEPDVAGRIVFLKEQQWPLGFGTTEVAEHPIRPSLRVTGSLVARNDGEITVTAPVAGRIASGGDGFPRLGERVAIDGLLGVLAPRLEAADLASLEVAVTSATLEVRFAARERQRLEALRLEGAVPERRVVDAEHAAEEAQATLSGARRRLDQFRRVQKPVSGKGGTVQVRAPLAGTITEVLVAPGAFVEAGDGLIRVTDLRQLWLEARVPEADIGRLGTARGGSFVVEGFDDAFELGTDSLVARGSHIDPSTQTLRLLFAVDNPDERLPIGAFARIDIANAEPRSAIAIPESALVDDGGISVVFVQVEGEAFERRIVRVGARDRGHVELLAGVTAGEHVVIRGAWSVKLAASSGSVPAHGHAH